MRGEQEREQGLCALQEVRQKVTEQSGMQTEPEPAEWKGPNQAERSREAPLAGAQPK